MKVNKVITFRANKEILSNIDLIKKELQKYVCKNLNDSDIIRYAINTLADNLTLEKED